MITNAIVLGILFILLTGIMMLLMRLEKPIDECSSSLAAFRQLVGDAVEFSVRDAAKQKPVRPVRAMIGRPPAAGLVSVSDLEFAHGETVIPPKTAKRVLLQPRRTSYCRPTAVCMSLWAEDWPALEQRGKVSGVSINEHPQLRQHDGHPDGTMSRGVSTDRFAAPAGYAIPCRWGYFSIETLIHGLVVEIWNDNQYPVHAQVQVYGEFMDVLPAGVRLGITQDELLSLKEQEMRDFEEYLGRCKAYELPTIRVGDRVSYAYGDTRRTGTVSSINYRDMTVNVTVGDWSDTVHVSVLDGAIQKERSNDDDDAQGS